MAVSRPKTRKDPNELRPCSRVEFCRANEAKSCDNCYDFFHRPHAEPAEEIQQAFDAQQDAAREEAEDGKWASKPLF